MVVSWTSESGGGTESRVSWNMSSSLDGLDGYTVDASVDTTRFTLGLEKVLLFVEDVSGEG